MRLPCAGMLGAALVAFLTGPSAAQQWSEGFEAGLAGAKPYHRELPQATLEISTENAAEGRQLVRATLPGERRLEGLSLTATGLSGDRVATISAKVRGTGDIWLCLHSRNGWLYSPQTTPLTEDWQEISLSKALTPEDSSLSINFLSKTAQRGAVFEVDELTVSLAPLPQVYEADVGPWRLEAEDFVLRGSYVAEDESGAGGRVARHPSYVGLDGMPFPRTSQPVTVYLRVRPGSEQDSFRLTTTQAGIRQTLRSIQPEQSGKWQWLRFPAMTAGEVGDCFGVECWRQKHAEGNAAIDCVVISTAGELADAALGNAARLFARRPLALVTRCALPPELDGKADDSCWQNTVACTDFLVVRSLTAASERTTARLCYDDDNLYLLLVCDEPVLEVRAQRRHEFVANVAERDGDVYRDDSCIVLLDPANTGEQLLDFTVNSLGTIADARCTQPSYWERRDLGWHSEAQASASLGDGTWTVEIAIPFADLTDGAPDVGEVWQICLGRIARAREENSSWNPSNRGFHDPQPLGALVFAEPTVGVALAAVGPLQLGNNPLTAALTPLAGRPGGVYLTSSIATASGTSHSYELAHVAEAPIEATHQFRIAEEAEVQMAHGVLDAGTLQPLYLTPVLERAVKSSLATVALACEGPYELLLNGEVISRGQRAEGVELQAPLQKGANVFALKLEKGTAAVAIAAPGLEAGSANWKIARADTDGATLPDTDDSTWETAPKVGEHPALGAIVGEPGQAVVLRHTLLWEKTRAWPTPAPALYIARNSNQHINVIADGLPGRKLEKWTVHLAVPPEFEILGSTGHYGDPVDYQPHFLCTQLGEQTVAGRQMQVARIAADKPIVRGRHYIMSLFNAFVRYREEAGPPENEETSFVYWTEANDRTVLEPRQKIPVRILPPLYGRQPKQLVWQLWGSFFSNMDDRAMREATLQTMQAAGINDLVSGDAWTSEVAVEYGIENTKGMNFKAWSLNMQPHLEEHPEARLVDKDGNPSDGFLCMTLLLGDSWPAVEAKLKEKIDDAHPHCLDYDYEYSPFGGPHSCYCPRCLSAFRDYAKLPADTKLDGQIIKEGYGDQWIDFMAQRVAEMFLKFKETIHRLAPGTKLSVYSGYQTPDNPSRYGVNWEYMGELGACDRIGCGYGRPVEAIPETIEALAGIPAVFGAILRPYDTTKTEPQVPLTKARLLRRSLDATGGVLIYDRLPMDGRTWFAIAEITRLVATFEQLLLGGRRTGLPGLDQAQVQALSDGNTTLVCAINQRSSPAQYTIPLPRDAGRGEEFYSTQKVAGGETVECLLPAGEVAVYVLSK